jgi:hypothetical protein
MGDAIHGTLPLEHACSRCDGYPSSHCIYPSWFGACGMPLTQPLAKSFMASPHHALQTHYLTTTRLSRPEFVFSSAYEHMRPRVYGTLAELNWPATAVQSQLPSLWLIPPEQYPCLKANSTDGTQPACCTYPRAQLLRGGYQPSWFLICTLAAALVSARARAYVHHSQCTQEL